MKLFLLFYREVISRLGFAEPNRLPYVFIINYNGLNFNPFEVKIMENKKTWGGVREGAGRPKGTTKTDNKKIYSFRLSEYEHEAVVKLLKNMRNR